jgi:uncharacterized protein (TIGR03790 family)
MDIPFSVSQNNVVNSTTSALFYGFKADTKSNGNSYAASEMAFGEVVPDTAVGQSFLATLITAGSLPQAKALVDRGVACDGTFPNHPVLLAKTTDPARNKRHLLFDHAIFNTRVAGLNTVERIDSNVVSGRSNLLGLQTGLASFSVSPNTFVPGAMADSMTSYGGIIFGPNGQTSLLAFIHAGASGSYGTVTEPGAVVTKFPDPMVYFYQARGFTLAECYYQGIRYPHQGLIVGEPLAAPYHRVGTGTWTGVESNAVLSGLAPLNVRFAAWDAEHPLHRVDLFVDGRYVQTLTNLAPAPGNALTAGFVGGTATYVVPGGASLASIAGGLADSINVTAATTSANIRATAYGDRIEVQSRSGTRPPAPQLSIGSLLPPGQGPSSTATSARLTESTPGSATALTTRLTGSRETSLDSTAHGLRSCRVSGLPQAGSWLRLALTKTSGHTVAVAVTNTVAGMRLMDFITDLANTVDAAPGFQAADGVTMEEWTATTSTIVTFNLRPRATGYDAAGARISLTTSPDLTVTLSGDDLRENLGDLLPRNHLYVREGVAELAVPFRMDTTQFADGWHELTAVAYEGSHVRTQTRASLPVRIQNTSLSATLSLPGLAAPAAAVGTYAADVTANQGGVASIRLFSTGGELDVRSGQSSVSFAVDAALLGVGRHPIWAVVESSGGQRYRTEPQWIRLVDNP